MIAFKLKWKKNLNVNMTNKNKGIVIKDTCFNCLDTQFLTEG